MLQYFFSFICSRNVVETFRPNDPVTLWVEKIRKEPQFPSFFKLLQPKRCKA